MHKNSSLVVLNLACTLQSHWEVWKIPASMLYSKPIKSKLWGREPGISIFFKIFFFFLKQYVFKSFQIIPTCSQDLEPLFWVSLVIHQSGDHCSYDLPGLFFFSLNVLPRVNLYLLPCYSFLILLCLFV